MKTAYLLITTRPGQTKIVSKSLLKLPAVVDLSEVYGHYDLIVKLQVVDDDELRVLYQQRISVLEGIAHIETLIAMETLVSYQVPAPEYDETSSMDSPDEHSIEEDH